MLRHAPAQRLDEHLSARTETPPSQLDEDQLVVDVSAGNDWSEVRVWYPPVNQLGIHAYAAHGFIHAKRPATPQELARATPAAARYALDTAGRPAPRARSGG